MERTVLKTLRMLALAFGVTASWCAAAADGIPPPRGLAPAATGIAPPTRIPPMLDAEPAPAGTAIPSATVPQSVRRAVAADAAKRFKVAESAVVLTGAEQVTWNDGSLGCAEPGRVYTQNLVPGYRIVAKTSAGDLAYHTDSRGYVVSCAATRAQSGIPPRARPAQAPEPVDGATPRTLPPAPVQPDR